MTMERRPPSPQFCQGTSALPASTQRGLSEGLGDQQLETPPVQHRIPAPAHPPCPSIAPTPSRALSRASPVVRETEIPGPVHPGGAAAAASPTLIPKGTKNQSEPHPPPLEMPNCVTPGNPAGVGNSAQPGQSRVLRLKGTLGKESKASAGCFSVPWSQEGVREVGESLHPRQESSDDAN